MPSIKSDKSWFKSRDESLNKKKEEAYLLITYSLLLDPAKIGVKYIGYDLYFLKKALMKLTVS